MGVFIGFFERFWLVFSKKHSLLQHAYLYSVTSNTKAKVYLLPLFRVEGQLP
jgi:hypothetical protein